MALSPAFRSSNTSADGYNGPPSIVRSAAADAGKGPVKRDMIVSLTIMVNQFIIFSSVVKVVDSERSREKV
jgi:hypothetical protein